MNCAFEDCLLLDEALHQAEEVLLERHVAGVDQRHAVEEDGEGEEDRVADQEHLRLILLQVCVLLVVDMLVVARRDHEERHVDDVEEEHDHLCRGRPRDFLDRPRQPQALAALRQAQHVLHLLEVARFEHLRVAEEDVERRQRVGLYIEALPQKAEREATSEMVVLFVF